MKNKAFKLTKVAKPTPSPFSLRLSPLLMEWVYEQAKKNGNSRNQEICNLVKSAKDELSTTIIKGNNHV